MTCFESRFVLATDWSPSILKLHIHTHEFEIMIIRGQLIFAQGGQF